MNLKLRGRNHAIVVGPNALPTLSEFLTEQKFNKVYLLCDGKLTQARKKVKTALKKLPIELHEIPLSAGEGLKDIQAVFPIYSQLLKKKADRDSLIIALGGGSIGDAAGFVASTYLRGIDWVGLPTTLLAQVDSSIGGKTGINHPDGKNLIGSFHQPRMVICETDFLKTLSSREITSGIGEIVKYAIAYDAKFFRYLDRNLPGLLSLAPKVTTECIRQSLQFKVKAVEADEFDRKGVREVLNFGHTFGHALETHTHYKLYQHGEAVIWGMKFAVALSVVRGHLSEADAIIIESLLKRIPLTPLPKLRNPKVIFNLMKKDKKSSQNQVRFVLLQKIGKSVSDREVTSADLSWALQRITHD